MKCSRTFEVGDHWMEPAVRVTRRAKESQAMSIRAQSIMDLRREPRLADPGLTGEQHDSAFAGLCVAPAPQQKVELLVAADNWVPGFRVQGFKSAVHVAGAHRLPHLQGIGESLDLHCSEVAVLKIARGEP